MPRRRPGRTDAPVGRRRLTRLMKQTLSHVCVAEGGGDGRRKRERRAALDTAAAAASDVIVIVIVDVLSASSR